MGFNASIGSESIANGSVGSGDRYLRPQQLTKRDPCNRVDLAFVANAAREMGTDCMISSHSAWLFPFVSCQTVYYPSRYNLVGRRWRLAVYVSIIRGNPIRSLLTTRKTVNINLSHFQVIGCPNIAFAVVVNSPRQKQKIEHQKLFFFSHKNQWTN